MGRVVLFDLSSQDPERAAAFYSSVFGWKISEPNWGYYPVTTGDDNKPGIHGGISKGPEFDHFYLAYLVDPVGNGIGLIQNK